MCKEDHVLIVDRIGCVESFHVVLSYLYNHFRQTLRIAMFSKKKQ